jgi:hypothetical protein
MVMTPCPQPGCRFVAKSPAGLASHCRGAHASKGGRNRRELEKTISILKDENRIKDIDAAKLQIARSVADALDSDPSNAQMWKVYCSLVDELTEETDASDETDDEVAKIRGTAQVGHLKAL